jgi:hypothetical protein
MPKQKQLSFHVLVEQHADVYVAHCLEMGLVATSLDEEDVTSKMTKLIVRHVEFAMAHDRLGDIYHPAPAEVFKRYVEPKGRPLGASQTSVQLDDTGGLWINQTAYAAAVC